jgi:hypothetical protein
LTKALAPIFLLYVPLTIALVSSRQRVFLLFLYLSAFQRLRYPYSHDLRHAFGSITKEISGMKDFCSGFCFFLNGCRHGASAPSSLYLSNTGIEAYHRSLAPPTKVKLTNHQRTTQLYSSLGLYLQLESG